jgi:hypothetical protein
MKLELRVQQSADAVGVTALDRVEERCSLIQVLL